MLFSELCQFFQKSSQSHCRLLGTFWWHWWNCDNWFDQRACIFPTMRHTRWICLILHTRFMRNKGNLLDLKSYYPNRHLNQESQMQQHSSQYLIYGSLSILIGCKLEGSGSRKKVWHTYLANLGNWRLIFQNFARRPMCLDSLLVFLRVIGFHCQNLQLVCNSQHCTVWWTSHIRPLLSRMLGCNCGLLDIDEWLSSWEFAAVIRMIAILNLWTFGLHH